MAGGSKTSDEFFKSFDNLEQWVEPSPELLNELKEPHKWSNSKDMAFHLGYLESEKLTGQEEIELQESSDKLRFYETVWALENRLHVSSNIQKIIVVEQEIAHRQKLGKNSVVSLGSKEDLYNSLLERKLNHFKSYYLPNKDRALPLSEEELKEIASKGGRWGMISKEQQENVKTRTREARQAVEDELSKAKSTSECIIILERFIEYTEEKGEFLFSEDDLYLNAEFYVHWLNTMLFKHKSALTLEVNTNEFRTSLSNLTSSPVSQEEIKAHDRVAAIFEKQSYWDGSLTDFVFVMNQLIEHGFLKTKDLEKTLADSFLHKGMGKDKPEKLTAEKINARRRSMKDKASRYKPSEGIKGTVGKIISKKNSQT
jgi:hypothetical protein